MRFRDTEWRPTVTGYGIQVAKLIVHTEYSNGPLEYNKPSKWNTGEKLKAFYRNPPVNISQYCLAHLFTTYAFPNAAGAAYLGTTSYKKPGGICCNGFPDQLPDGRWRTLYQNAGLSSTMSPGGRTFDTPEQVSITSHELGHGWGAQHDPDTPECNPSSAEGGYYIMWVHSYSGRQANNLRFSPCSRRDVALVLGFKSHMCFIEDSSDVTPPITTPISGVVSTTTATTITNVTAKPHKNCGNAQVDYGEECDVGLLVDGRQDPCCTPECKLKSGSQCSEVNVACCVDCKTAPMGTVCAGDLTTACKKEAVCDGVSQDCPDRESVEDNTTCLEKGTCYGGRCLSFCQSLGVSRGETLRPCLCDQDRKDWCKFCCLRTVFRDGKTTTLCEPTQELLTDGRPCVHGLCKNGVCEEVGVDTFHRIFGRHPSQLKGLVQATKTNIAGTIITVSLVFWIPGSICTWRRDKRIYQREQQGP
ncbi:hypothetical protein BaRGS_00009060 [Batillaria attramentaria]|uniref:Uncharacterized protein n=1 Tax=Batillaria attramentaria TaxID=370345 RepID=A0ABD0LL76_9CAEN